MARLSIVVPVYNEEANVPLLVEEIRESLGEGDWELLIVDDGSTDRTRDVARSLSRQDPRVRHLRLARNYGQSAAMQAGFDHSRGEVVVTLDGDLQNDPHDIPTLVAKLKEGYDLVTGYRQRRRDALLRRKLPSWVANRIIRWMTGVKVRDNGCSLKAYRRELLRRLRLYSDMHRFIPAMAAGTAGARITEIPVAHRARRYGKSKYGLGRTWKVALDLITIKMIRSFRDRPLLLFGGAGMSTVGVSLLFLVATWWALRSPGVTRVGAYVFPSVAMLLLGLAGFLTLLGLIGEATVRQASRSHGIGLPLEREAR